MGSFCKWLQFQETGTSTGSIAGYALPLFGHAGGNAFIAGDAQQQAKDCGLAMCGGGMPRRKKKRRKKIKKHHRHHT